MSVPTNSPALPSLPENHPWLPYVAPMAAYVLCSTLEAQLPQGPNGTPHPIWYPVAYAAKALIVALLMVRFRSTWRDLLPLPRKPATIALAVLLGLLVTLVWVGLEPFVGGLTGWQTLYPRFGSTGTRIAFDPGSLGPLPRVAFLATRMVGLVVLVPIFEELFWRSFLMRLVIDPDDFRRVAVGRVTLTAAAITSAGFALVHPEWLPALLTGLGWAWLLHQTRSLSACVLSHAVANLALGIYILVTGSWQYW